MAIDTIKSSAVLDGAIATADIADDAITTAKLGSVTDIASSSGAMTLSPAGTEILNVGTTGDILVKGQGSNRAALILRAGANNANSQIRLGDQAADDVGRIMYDHSDDTLRFQTAGAERFRVSASGIHIGGTGAANALDDYEEGTFTPAITGLSLTTALGHYTKIGNVVHWGVQLGIPSTSAGTHFKINNPPFTNATNQFGGAVIYANHNVVDNPTVIVVSGEIQWYKNGSSFVTYADYSGKDVRASGAYLTS